MSDLCERGRLRPARRRADADVRDLREAGRRRLSDVRPRDRADLDAKTTVLGIVRGDDAVGYPAPVVAANGGVVADTVDESSVIVVGSDPELHAFEDPGHDFEFREGRLFGDGTTWDLATGRSDDGRRLTRVPARRLYAFAWQDDHGSGSFYGLGPW